MDGRYIYAHTHARSGTDTGQIQKHYKAVTADKADKQYKQLKHSKSRNN